MQSPNPIARPPSDMLAEAPALQSASANAEITQVRSKAQMNRFIRLPRVIYKGMDGFDPPLDMERRNLIAPPKAPFLKAGEAVYWLATRNDRPIGRISAQIIKPHSGDDIADTTIGYFGCIDAIDDAPLVAALLETAAGWLRDQGCRIARGPFTLSINGETGLQLSGQARGGMILLPWHPRYLAGHVEAAGFIAAKDVVSYTYLLSQRAPFADWLMERSLIDAMPGVSVRGLDRANLRRDMEIIRDVYNDAWRKNWGFLPVSSDEAVALEKATRDLLEPDCGVIVERDGAPVAAALLLPNLFEITRDFDGRLLPFNWLKLLVRLRRKPYRSARILLFGVRPEESKRPQGALIPAIILCEYLKRAPRYQIDEIDMGWVLDHRSEIRNMLDRTGAKVTRTHRIFEKTL